MKSIIRVICVLIIGSFLFFGCKNQDSNQNTGMIAINLEEMVDNEKIIGLAEIAAEVEYIPLETLSEALLNPTKLLYVNKKIFVLNRSGEVYLFNDEGKFERKIGKIGPGPEEYLGAQQMEVSSDGSLIYLYLTKGNNIGYTYDLEGVKINSFRLSYSTWRFAPLSEGRHIMISPYGSFSPDSAKFLFYLQDDLGNVIQKYPSTQVIKMMGDFSIGSFFIDPERVLAYQPFCDTVFQVDAEGEMIPVYHFNFGGHRAPDELFEDMANVMNPTKPYYLSPRLYQTKDQLFIRIKELRKYHIGIYRYDNGTIFSIKSDNRMIPNDLDGGPDFWPSRTDGDQLMYRMLLPVDLLNPDKENLTTQLEVKDANAADTYQKLLKSLTENDNPVVMVVKLKD